MPGLDSPAVSYPESGGYASEPPAVNGIRRIAVIGAGALGRRLARLASEAGYAAVLEDVLPSRLRVAAEELVGEAVAGTVIYAASVEEAVREADLVVDCVPDELESKLEIFSLVDRMAPPRTILATPTHALSIADLASCTYRPERCLALRLPAEFLGTGTLPVPCPLHIVRTGLTDAAVLGAMVAFWESLGLEVTVGGE